MFRARDFALAVMDLMLPGLSGESLLPKLKEIQQIPVIVVSAKDSLDSKVNLLTSGAEDYLTKPFEIQELVARVGVQIRRFAGDDDTSAKMLKYKDLILNQESFTASANGTEIPLTKQEFKILSCCFLIRTKCIPSRISTIMRGMTSISGKTRPSMSTSAISARS